MVFTKGSHPSGILSRAVALLQAVKVTDGSSLDELFLKASTCLAMALAFAYCSVDLWKLLSALPLYSFSKLF